MFNLPISKRDVNLIKKVFFLAMMEGYVGNSKKVKIVELPGSKTITFEHKEKGHHFVVTDTYWVTKFSDYSSGITVICCDGEPVWSMTYGGMYPKKVIPFLKLSLKWCYSKREFNGGRGPTSFSSSEYPGLFYENTSDCVDFKDFEGYEIIYQTSDQKKIGYHYFIGNLMLPFKK